MATPIIQSSGSVSGAGTAGEGRKDLVLGETVDLSDAEGANSGASYFWEFLDTPPGSATILSGDTSATPSFVPDTEGSYWVQAIVDGSDVSSEILAVSLTVIGDRVPAFNETDDDYDAAGNQKGWHPALHAILTYIDDNLNRFNVRGPFTSNQTAAENDLMMVDPSGGGFDINLPVISNSDQLGSFNNQGMRIAIKNVTDSTNAVNIVPNGTDTVDGESSLIMASGYFSVVLVSDGSGEWMIL